MSESAFKYKTRGGASPENKPKVYFACHPEDFDRYFESVCSDIFETQDCVIFFTEDMNAKLNDENTLVDLERMNLYVIPVTFRLLTTDNRAMNFDYRFAQEKHIPVLPLMMESSIYDFYKKPENFGELQYLKPQSTDDTAIDYKDKLKKYLESVLISDELAQRIRKAFDAYIFLSYRKKDRKYANELMKLIHKNPKCEDIAIWFDEFLTPGESFRENIAKILKDSKLFTLLVTPSLLERYEDGTPNFVMREEYPAAKRQGKRILPAEMVNTNKEELVRDYEGIPECTDPMDEESFNKRLLDSLVGIAITENNNDPEHNYLIGLAYLKGIDVEIDIDRGVRLITKAAEADLPEAVEKLCQMYRDADSVKLDYKRVLKWAKRLFEIRVIQLGKEHPDTLDSLNNLANAYHSLGDYKKAIKLYEKCYATQCKVLGEDHPYTLDSLDNLAVAYDSLGDYRIAFELHERCYELRRRVLGEIHPRTLKALYSLGNGYFHFGEYRKAFELYEKCYATQCRVLGEEHLYTLASLNNLALTYFKLFDFEKALELHEKCYEIGCGVLGEEHPFTLNVLGNLSIDYNLLGNYKKSFELQEKCYATLCRVLGEDHPSTLISLNNLAILYEFYDEKKAVELHEKCYAIRCRVLGEDHEHTIVSLNNLGILLSLLGDYSRSIELHKKCYGICCRVYGKEDVNTLNSLGNLSLAYKGLGDTKKSLELIEDCYETSRIVLGDDHSTTQRAYKRYHELCNEYVSEYSYNFPVIEKEENKKEYSLEDIKFKLQFVQKKIEYKKLIFCNPSDPNVRKAIAEYASGIEPNDAIAIDDHTSKFYRKPKGILFTKDGIYSSFLEKNNHINYKEIKHVSLSINGIRFKLRNDDIIECDFGHANDFILAFLNEIGISK